LPNDAKVKFDSDLQRAIYLWRFERYEEASRYFEKAIQENPYSTMALSTAILMYSSIGDQAAADRIYREAFDRYRKNVDKMKQDTRQFGNIMGFLMESDMLNEDLLGFLQNLECREDSEVAVMKNVLTTIILQRQGKVDEAKELLEKNTERFIQFITDNSQPYWPWWKYAYEIVDINHNVQKKVHPFENILANAQTTHRKKMGYLMQYGMARFNSQTGRVQKQRDIYQELGSPVDSVWRIIGPFPFGNYSAFDYEFPPEKKIDINVSYNMKNRDIRWLSATDKQADGYVDFTEIFKENTWSVAYALVYVHSPVERVVQIRLGTDEACKLWLNNKKIWQHYIKSDAMIDRDLITVLLHPGYNKILLKITNNFGDWGFFFRVTDEEGNGFPDVTFHSYNEVEKSFARR
jgi:tetratricopeptide (TPR) repeat protein